MHSLHTSDQESRTKPARGHLVERNYCIQYFFNNGCSNMEFKGPLESLRLQLVDSSASD